MYVFTCSSFSTNYLLHLCLCDFPLHKLNKGDKVKEKAGDYLKDKQSRSAVD